MTISTTICSLVQSTHVIEEMTATSLHYNAIIGPVNMLSISEVCFVRIQSPLFLSRRKITATAREQTT